MFAEPYHQHYLRSPLFQSQVDSSNKDQGYYNSNSTLGGNNLQPSSDTPPLLISKLRDLRQLNTRDHDMGEHMLRRKTPNGTLSAGFDGTPVEWGSNKRPMAELNSQRYSFHEGQSQSLNLQNVKGQEMFDGMGARLHYRMPIVPGPESSLPPQIWLPEYNKSQSLDSMLYQPAQNLNIYHNPMYPVPHVIQPGFWPPNHPLTVSNAQSRFGPYWPDGSFEPFRPSAFRDSQPQWTDHGLGDQNVAPSFKSPFNQRHELQGWDGSNGNLPFHQPHDPRAGFSRHLGELNPLTPQTDTYRAPDMRMFPAQNSSPITSQWPPALNPINSTESTHPQFKNWVLYWAHRTHSNLLETRRQSMPKSLKSPSSRPMKRPISQRRDSVSRSNDSPSQVHLTPFHNQSQEQRSFSDRIHSRSNNVGIGNGEISPTTAVYRQLTSPTTTTQTSHPPTRTPLYNAIREAQHALRILDGLCSSSNWTWTDGILLGGCLAYGLEQFENALQWYERVLLLESDNVEALSNTAAAFSALKRVQEAENYWHRAVKLRPNHWEAVEHLVGLLCQDHRPRDAVNLIENVEHALRFPQPIRVNNQSQDPFSFFADDSLMRLSLASNPDSGYNIPSAENGRLVALIHAKGNMLYALGDNLGASKAFEEAILLVCGRRPEGITGLIKHILGVFSRYIISQRTDGNSQLAPYESILLAPSIALETKRLVFPANGQLPGLRDVQSQLQSTAVLYASNSLLSLAKIYQDGMSTSTHGVPRDPIPGVQDILALYYLSLSLQPSPSTANNVGILLASVQQTVPQRYLPQTQQQGKSNPSGVVHGSGISLALAYYNYGLSLDDKHAHLYTNLGSLLKDIGQLNAAIKMYENAVKCDGNFDIALANLANAVKDQGRISEAIDYYRRAVKSSPDFPEAVCGLANALNSVCNWKGRGGVIFNNKKHDRWHVDDKGMLIDAWDVGVNASGWIGRVVAIVEKQLQDGKSWGSGIIRRTDFSQLLSRNKLTGDLLCNKIVQEEIVKSVKSWANQEWEGAKIVRMIERATRRLGWQMYQERHVLKVPNPVIYQRPQLPYSLTVPGAPTVLPFHTFTCPLTANQIRKISQRNGLRISCSTLKAPWLPNILFEPPLPPQPYLKVGYVSSDFNNHPLAHLMQSVFGFHDRSRVQAICYATTPSDNSMHRDQIQKESPVFHDASSWSVDRLVKKIVEDGIHVLVNLNGYTRGARNEVFAARPAPIQMSFMGFAGTLGAEWCDYLLADDIAVPPSMLRPWRDNVTLLDQAKDNNYSDDNSDWVYGENIIFAKETFFCCDHKQSAPDAKERQLPWIDELERRRIMRKQLFPDLGEDAIILGNFNQLYKIEPTTFRTWLRILQALPKAILWLLRFPDLGEQNLIETAAQWSTPSVASRIIFTDVAPKNQHISRARVCDLFLDTPECNAHTTAADVLWSGTPLLTLPRYSYKMCSRMAASILRGALPRGIQGDNGAHDLTASSDADYESKAVALARGLFAVLSGERETCRLLELRKMLYEGRWTSALFDTKRWVRHVEYAYEEAWRKWVAGEGGDIWLKDVIPRV